jgi:hypothetical protein
MRNDWEKSPNDRKEEAFHASDETRARAKSKKVDKPFLVEIRYTQVKYVPLFFLMEWHGKRKYETLEDAKAYVKKLGRENIASRREVRIIDTRDGSQHALD